MYRIVLFFSAICILKVGLGQHSIARKWNEVLLESIRNDFARPTVHARNLFHTSVAMYDAWAAYDETAETYLLGKNVNGHFTEFEGVAPCENYAKECVDEAISYASYRLMKHRFINSPGKDVVERKLDSLFNLLNYDADYTNSDYSSGSPAALGNYIAESLIEYGHQDGSNEINDYANLYYEPRNNPIAPASLGNDEIIDPNLWQPLALDIIIDQSGNVIPDGVTKFLSPEWGHVSSFALNQSDLQIHERDGHEYWVYHDPGPPPTLQWGNPTDIDQEYKWGFSLVNIWSAHLDASDGVMWDISPGSIGNISEIPTKFEDFRNFYNTEEGGDPSLGHDENPFTGLPYEPNVVPRGDYTRVLAEFWADGPDSETPPGHWFTILNYVSDHPLLEKKYRGTGEVLDDLEWDVKAYFMLGGAMHDAAISAWGIKGWYDYIRPISAIRAMAARGQSSDPELPSYTPDGIPLVPGFVELIEDGDPLEGTQKQNIGKIKFYAWKGPNFVSDPDTDVAGVGWIISDIWWPYQRPSFVTPPFAGYVSGHSTFSRASAEVLTYFTGSEFFPGGLGEFEAKQNEFLVFEDGPSVDVILQWATYRDASDQTSLSRIWGGIHPPADDIPGRHIGVEVAADATVLADKYFSGNILSVKDQDIGKFNIYPNPLKNDEKLQVEFFKGRSGILTIFNASGSQTASFGFKNQKDLEVQLPTPGLNILVFDFPGQSRVVKRIISK